ncbi:MAG TPA: hypothetical protein PK037_08970, partial [Saprospiraceae bacterium]|nr:hypothetical protein [Saprospiraceae bacterium]
MRDSIELASKPKKNANVAQNTTKATTTNEPASDVAIVKDSQLIVENELIKATFGSRGGKLLAVELKKYDKVQEIDGVPNKSKVVLLNDEKNE